MRPACARGSGRRLVVSVVLLALAAGCDAVSEDRHVAFSPSGNSVAFQHGSDGVFLADPKTGELKKVFDPDPAILAVSTPEWSEDETQAVFTTALAVEPPRPTKTDQTKSPTASTTSQSTATPADWNDAPTGRLFLPQPIVYTCWLVERNKQSGLQKPVNLFQARCEHSGYVAGNLAVRWRANRKQILFIERDSPLDHAVWSFDLATKQKKRLFPPAGQPAPAFVLADFLGDGKQILCVATARHAAESQVNQTVANKTPADSSGIWIGSAQGTNWWHVPQSYDSKQQAAFQGLSSLASHRPVCTADGRLIAFLKEIGQNEDKKSRSSVLYRARMAGQKVETAFQTTADIRDLHFSPDGSQLGFILAEPTSSGLRTIDAQGRVHELFADRFAREFAGWNASGDKLACVVAEKTPPKEPSPSESQIWALLLHDPLVRDAVLVSDVKGATRTIASDLRFTFPQWSPKRDQLSMWGTFSPTYALPAEMGGGLGLRQGDPAAVVDVSTGAIRWLAINGDEMAQVGHYDLLKHDPAGAREWYRKADLKLAKLEPLRPQDLIHGLSGAAARRRTFEFFYYLCLVKLDQPKEAAERLALFDAAHRIEWPAATERPENDSTHRCSSTKSRQDAETLVAIAKAFSIAQIFLSLDEPDAARAWFERRVPTADAVEREADLMVLSQLSLIAKDNQGYANLVTDRLAPLLAESLEDPAPAGETALDSPAAIRTTLAVLAAHALGPLFSDEFLKELPADFVGQLVPKWEALRGPSRSHLAALYVNLVLRAAAARLGHEKERADVTARILQNPVASPSMLSGQLEIYLRGLRPAAKAPEGGRL
jgi:hypothetical protein